MAMVGQIFCVPRKFSIIDLEQVWRTTLMLYSLGISAISLKFGGMMYIAMKHIVIDNGHARPNFLRTTEIFHDRLMIEQVWGTTLPLF